MSDLLFDNLRGGYVRSNKHPNTSLMAYMTGTTAAKYVMPGWEVAWLYMKHPDRHAQKNPIRIGEFQYQLIGSKADIKGLLSERGEQPVEGATIATAVATSKGAFVPGSEDHLPHSVQEAYFFGGGPQIHLTQGGELYIDIYIPPKPPSTLAREAMLAMGSSFVGMGGGAAPTIQTIVGLADWFDEHVGEALVGESLKGAAEGKVQKLAKLSKVLGFLSGGTQMVLELTTQPTGKHHGHVPLPTTFAKILKFLGDYPDTWPH